MWIQQAKSPTLGIQGLCLVIGLAVCQASLCLEIDTNTSYQELNQGVRFLVDDQSHSIQSIQALPDVAWRVSTEKINLGYLSESYWFRLDLAAMDSAEQRGKFLELAYPLLDHVEFYELVDGELVQQYVTGDKLPFSVRPIDHRNFVFPLSNNEQAHHQVYLKISTSGALQLPLVLWDERSFFAASEKNLVWRAMIYGLLLVMAAFNLLLFFSLKERAYLFYVLFVGNTLLTLMSLDGFSFQYLYPSYPRIHDLMMLVTVPLEQITICLFTMEFLALKKQNRFWHRLFLMLIAISCLCLVAALMLPYSVSTRLSVVTTLPVCVAALAAGIKFWNNGDRSARIFTIAWFAFLVGVSIVVLNKLGLLPTLFLTEYGMPMSTAAQVVLFALALADRFHNERDARVKAQDESYQAMRKRREAESRALYAASHHEITGLPNRMVFERVISSTLDDEKQACPEEFAVVLVHIHRFDEVNKTLGHKNADILIGKIGIQMDEVITDYGNSTCLEETAKGCAHLAHIEGVSFAFTYMGVSRESVLCDIETLVKKMSQPIEFMGLSLDMRLLTGVSFTEPETDVQTLLRRAFIAFDAAHHTVHHIAVYTPEMNPYSERRLTLMAELRSALENDGLELYFQPQIHLTTRSVCGFEALLRWIHPEYGFVPPDEFIPMAETTGLMPALTRWVIKTALDFCKELERMHCDASVAVNISAMNLREPGFCQQVCELLNANKVPHNRLVLEVTETAAMTDPKSALSVLQELQEANVRLSIDDFGTGHSSLSYIQKLPVQEIKIDRAFVMEMDANQGDKTIVRTTVNMCHDLGYHVVAEGVENEDIVKLLDSYACDIIQGYHIARPMNRKAVLAWLENTEWNLAIHKKSA